MNTKSSKEGGHDGLYQDDREQVQQDEHEDASKENKYWPQSDHQWFLKIDILKLVLISTGNIQLREYLKQMLSNFISNQIQPKSAWKS